MTQDELKLLIKNGYSEEYLTFNEYSRLLSAEKSSYVVVGNHLDKDRYAGSKKLIEISDKDTEYNNLIKDLQQKETLDKIVYELSNPKGHFEKNNGRLEEQNTYLRQIMIILYIFLVITAVSLILSIVSTYKASKAIDTVNKVFTVTDDDDDDDDYKSYRSKYDF